MGSHTNSTMMFSGCLLLAVSVSALPQPQLEELKNTLTSVFGGGSDDDYEKVPYEVLGKYEGYEMRKYMVDTDTESKFHTSINLLPFILILVIIPAETMHYSIPSTKENQIIFRHVSSKVEEEF